MALRSGLVYGNDAHKVLTNLRPAKVCKIERWTPYWEQAKLLGFGMGIIEAENRAWVDF